MSTSERDAYPSGGSVRSTSAGLASQSKLRANTGRSGSPGRRRTASTRTGWVAARRCPPSGRTPRRRSSRTAAGRPPGAGWPWSARPAPGPRQEAAGVAGGGPARGGPGGPGGSDGAQEVRASRRAVAAAGRVLRISIGRDGAGRRLLACAARCGWCRRLSARSTANMKQPAADGLLAGIGPGVAGRDGPGPVRGRARWGPSHQDGGCNRLVRRCANVNRCDSCRPARTDHALAAPPAGPGGGRPRRGRGGLRAERAAPRAETTATLHRILPLLLFLGTVIVLAELTAVAGVFDVLASRLAIASRGRWAVLFLLCGALATLTTLVLNLDTTAVLLTPVLLALARNLRIPAAPLAVTTVWLANTAEPAAAGVQPDQPARAPTASGWAPLAYAARMGVAAARRRWRSPWQCSGFGWWRKDRPFGGRFVPPARARAGRQGLHRTALRRLPDLRRRHPRRRGDRGSPATVGARAGAWSGSWSAPRHASPGAGPGGACCSSSPACSWWCRPSAGTGLATCWCSAPTVGATGCPARRWAPERCSPTLVEQPARLPGRRVGAADRRPHPPAGPADRHRRRPAGRPWASLATLLWFERCRAAGVAVPVTRFVLTSTLLAVTATLAAVGALLVS